MSDEISKKIRTYKIVILGASSVGKTSLVNQYVNNYFDHLIEKTSDDFNREYIKLVDLNKADPQSPQHRILKILDLFAIDHPDLRANGDKAKQDMLTSVIKNDKPLKEDLQDNVIYNNKIIYGYMFVYDMTNPESLVKIAHFIEFISENEKKNASGHSLITKKILVGNKSDMATKRDRERINKTMKESLSGMKIPTEECSAMENIHIEQVEMNIYVLDKKKCFEKLAGLIYSDTKFDAYDQEQIEQDADDDKNGNGRSANMNTENRKGRKMPKGRGGFLGCGGNRREEIDDDDKDEDNQDDTKQEKDDVELPQMGDQERNKCSLF